MDTAVKNYIDKRKIEKRKYEIVGGKKYMPPSAKFEHSVTIIDLCYVFRNIIDMKKFRMFSDVDTIFDKDNIFRPDFAIISDFSKIVNGRLQAAPDFIAEVLSPSNADHDFVTKKNLYEKHGVKEYWIVDIYTRNIHVYVLKDGIYSDPNIYHSFTDEEIEEIEQGYDDEDKEQVKITHISSRTFGEEIQVPIGGIFENLL
jgi:Uma2 family endonuclease